MAEDNKEMTAIAYQAARENFEALMEGLGQSDVEMMQFEFTDAVRRWGGPRNIAIFDGFRWA